MKHVATVVLSCGLLAPQLAHAQGTRFISNLEESSFGSVAVGNDSRFAALFQTGPASEGYTLDSIQLSMAASIGNPSGFSVSLYSSDIETFLPGSNLASLSGPEPLSSGVFTYSASGVTLSPATAYFIVTIAGTTTDQGTFNWNQANSDSFYASGGWILADSLWHSSNTSNWALVRQFPLQFAVHATPIPEPASGLLIVIGGIGFASYQFRRIRSLKAQKIIPKWVRSRDSYTVGFSTYVIIAIKGKEDPNPHAWFTSQPESQSALVGSGVIFTANAEPWPYVDYQWYFKNKAMPGKTWNWLHIPAVTKANAGIYTVGASMGGKPLMSSRALLRVPVSVNTVHGGGTSAVPPHPYIPPSEFSDYYEDNGDPTYSTNSPVANIQYDGMTVLLTGQANITSNTWLRVKIAIADYSIESGDRADRWYDSAILIGASSPCP